MMNIMFKKQGYLYKLLIILLIVMTTIGCNGEDTTDKNLDKDKGLTGTVRIWCSERSKDSINNAFKLLKQNNPELNIVITTLSEGEIHNNLSNKSLDDEDYPHIIEVGSYQIPKLLKVYPEVFTPVDKAIDKIKDKFLPWKLEEITYEKKPYAIPWNTEPKVLIYNKKLAEENKVNPFGIKTWLEFSDLGIFLKDQSLGNQKLIALKENEDGNLYKSMLRQFRKGLYPVADYISLPEENKYVLSSIRGMYKEEIIYTLKEGEDPLQALKDGKALCILGDSSDISRLNKEEAFNSFQWEVHSLPAFEYGGKRAVHGEGNVFMLTKKTEGDKVAVDFINFLLTDFDSVTYSLKEDGIIPSIPVLYNLPEFNISSNNYQNIKLWRFMAEQSKEEEAVDYDHRYDLVEKELLKLEGEAIEGQDLEILLTLHEKELNKILENSSTEK